MSDLYGLWLDIEKSGLHSICGRCEISTDHTKIFMTYRDNRFNEQFVFIERKRDTGYRISTNKKPETPRTKKAALEYLQKFLLAAVEGSDKYTVITVAEYAQLVGPVRYNQHIELDNRLKDSKRYNVYLDKKYPKT